MRGRVRRSVVSGRIRRGVVDRYVRRFPDGRQIKSCVMIGSVRRVFEGILVRSGIV